MGSELPVIERREFSDRLLACSPEALSVDQIESLFLHYSELRRWNRRLSLVGPTAAAEIVERHYGESLAALPLLPARQGVLVDVGTGGGFPGVVLAVARPGLDVVLVEARGRKWSFLKSICRVASLSCKCLNARVGSAPVEGLPEKIDWITTRAVKIEDLGLSVLLPRLAHEGTLLYWSGVKSPNLPQPLQLRSEVHLAGSSGRWIREIVKEPTRSEPE